MSVEEMEIRRQTLQVVVARDHRELGHIAAGTVAEALRGNPHAVISLTTGRTTAGLFAALRNECRAGRIDLARAQLILSEEYAGVAGDDPISLFGWLRRALLDPCRVAPQSVLRLAGDAPSLDAECRRFDRVLEQLGAIDLIVQSIGVNGHFGFNEPGATRDAPSRVVTMAPTTWAVNAAYWPHGARIPHQGLTMGLAATLRARHVLLLAAGAAKADALARTLEGPIDSEAPCSMLRLARRLTVIADEAAASALVSLG